MLFNVDQVLHALYIGALGREPDASELESNMKLLEENPSALIDVVGRFMSYVDHSQFGEFRLFLKHLVGKGQTHGIIVDVGVNGREGSNSFDLLKNFGWRGLLVEANPRTLTTIKRDFSGTDFTLIDCAVSDTEGTMPFYIGIIDGVSSLSKPHAAAWGDIRNEVQVKVRRLGSILEENKIPYDFDILSIDIEGHDVRVLNDLIETTQFRPNLIVIETSMAFKNQSLEDAGASDAVRAAYSLSDQTYANMILARL